MGATTIKAVVQYVGTDYFGFQRQAAGRPTVQGALEDAIAVLTGERVTVTGAGRTDAGVHAHGQVIHFRTASAIPVDRWPAALNSRLPRDIAVVAAEKAPDTFHARFHARSKVYRYTLWNSPVPSPFWRPFSWWVRHPLDVAAMAEAAALLVGRHDFAAFAAAGSSARTTVRTVFSLRVEEGAEPVGGPGRLVHVWVEGDGFLYRMVRNVVGSLVEVGAGRRPPRWVEQVLRGRRRERAAPTAPPEGLTLWLVRY